MKKIPYIAAAVIAAITLLTWASTGFHTGWTQTNIPVTEVDAITGIEYTTFKEGFVAGIDVLVVGLAIAVGISAITLGLQKLGSRKPQ